MSKPLQLRDVGCRIRLKMSNGHKIPAQERNDPLSYSTVDLLLPPNTGAYLFCVPTPYGVGRGQRIPLRFVPRQDWESIRIAPLLTFFFNKLISVIILTHLQITFDMAKLRILLSGNPARTSYVALQWLRRPLSKPELLSMLRG